MSGFVKSTMNASSPADVSRAAILLISSEKSSRYRGFAALGAARISNSPINPSGNLSLRPSPCVSCHISQSARLNAYTAIGCAPADHNHPRVGCTPTQK